MDIKNYKFAKLGLVALVIILIIVVLISVCFKFWKDKSDVGVQSSNNTFQSLYQNKEYGFQLTLNDSWKGYRVVKEFLPNSAVRLAFQVPIEDKSYGRSNGWVSPFMIDVYPKAFYKIPKGDPVGDYTSLNYKDDDTYLGENDLYFFQKRMVATDIPGA